MSRKLTVVLLAMLVLAGAMGLKTALAAHGRSGVLSAGGGRPMPPPWPDPT
jgi:hypothetical protein